METKTENPFAVYEPTNTNNRRGLSSKVASPPRFCYKQKVGNMYVVKVLKSEKMKVGESELDVPTKFIMFGPCWPMIIFVVVAMFLVSFAFMGFSLIMKNEADDDQVDLIFLIIVCAGSLLLFSTCIFYLMTACSNPGIQPLLHRERTQSNDDKFSAQGYLWSDQLQVYKKRDALYDAETGLVIDDIDHFCPWTGTTIAKNNMKQFIAFHVTCCIGFWFFVLISLFLLTYI